MRKCDENADDTPNFETLKDETELLKSPFSQRSILLFLLFGFWSLKNHLILSESFSLPEVFVCPFIRSLQENTTCLIKK